MLTANKNNERIFALKGERATCPGCGAPVIAKCGEINIWHWAHASRDECDWYKGETMWHLEWKSKFPASDVEVIVGEHRADVLHEGHVFEFQSKALSPEEMKEREMFWRRKGYKFSWIFNLTDNENFYLGKCMTHTLHPTPKYGFRWKWGWRSLKGMRDFYLDLGNGEMFKVNGIEFRKRCFGNGILIDKKVFLKTYIKQEKPKI